MTVLASPESRMTERLRAALAFAGVGAWEWDLRTGEAWWSDHVYVLLGRAPGDIPTSLAAFLECVVHEDREAVWAALRDVLQTGESRALACRIVRLDGSIRWCQGQLGAIPEESGRCRLILGTLRDTTDEAERHSPDEALLRALREQRNELLTVLEATPRPLLLVDALQRILRTNRATEAMFGWRAAELTGRPLSVLAPDPAEVLDALLIAATARGETGQATRLVSARTRDGRVFQVKMTVSAATASDGARFVVMLEPVVLEPVVPGPDDGASAGDLARPLTPLQASAHRA